jgi:hypothetical protein
VDQSRSDFFHHCKGDTWHAHTTYVQHVEDSDMESVLKGNMMWQTCVAELDKSVFDAWHQE